MPSARSCPAGLSSSPAVAVMSRMSSRIWNTMPKQWPYSVRASTSESGPATGQRADAARRGRERGRLPGDGPDVVLPGPGDLEGRADLGDLPLTEVGQRVGEERGDLDAQAGGDRGRAGQQVVAGHDGDQISETAVYALDVAADRGLVDHVVVIQRGQMDEFDRHRAHQLVVGCVTLPARGRGQGPGGAEGVCHLR